MNTEEIDKKLLVEDLEEGDTIFWKHVATGDDQKAVVEYVGYERPYLFLLVDNGLKGTERICPGWKYIEGRMTRVEKSTKYKYVLITKSWLNGNKSYLKNDYHSYEYCYGYYRKKAEREMEKTPNMKNGEIVVKHLTKATKEDFDTLGNLLTGHGELIDSKVFVQLDEVYTGDKLKKEEI